MNVKSPNGRAMSEIDSLKAINGCPAFYQHTCFEVGIIGVAGGQLATRIPDDSWRTYSVGVNLIQSDYTGKRKSRHEFEPAGYAGNYRTAVLLDGVFLCMRRDLYGTVRFDETLPHFHGYDVDICLQTIIAGYTNYVIYDVLLEHFSWGRMTGVYYRNLFSADCFKKTG